jgi:hypothetical protein
MHHAPQLLRVAAPDIEQALAVPEPLQHGGVRPLAVSVELNEAELPDAGEGEDGPRAVALHNHVSENEVL